MGVMYHGKGEVELTLPHHQQPGNATNVNAQPSEERRLLTANAYRF